MTINILGYKIDIKKEVIAVFITVLVFLAGLGGYLIVKGNRDIIISSENETGTEESKGNKENEAHEDTAAAGGEQAKASVSNGIEDKKKDEIKIYIVGCVNNPGVVTMEKGQLIDDAVKLAGGFTKDADPCSVNLVYKLEENLMLFIKSKNDLKKESQGAVDSGAAGKGVKIEKNSGGAVVNEQVSDTAPGTAGGKVNINTASVSELNTLSGIGDAKAKDIISYREANGLFKTIEDIMKVPGIKENSFLKIKEHITVK